MKRIILLLTIYFLFPLAARSESNVTRIGITFLGTGFLSASIEQHFGSNSLRLNIGIFEFSELCTALTVNRYFTASDVKPHVGIGLWNVFIFPEGHVGRLDILNVPVGIDYKASDKHSIGLEGDINYFIGGKDPGGGKVHFNKDKRSLPLPAVYYKYKL